MIRPSSLELIHELARDVAPVRRVVRLRFALPAVLALCATGAAVGVVVLGFGPQRLSLLEPWRPLGLVVTGLGIAGLGGIAGALALSIPGRERMAWTALLFGLGGAALAVGAAAVLLSRQPAGIPPAPQFADLQCLSLAALIALPPALAVVSLAARAAPLHPRVLTLAAVAGTVALGAIGAELTCPYVDARHLLVAHALAPALGSALLAGPVYRVLRTWMEARRRREREARYP